MTDASTTGKNQPPPAARPEGDRLPSSAEAAADEDFLYHLYRGSELLMEDRVVEAKEELERALALQPQDAKGQDLLAGVYFRLGVYPRAIEIWRLLAAAYPRDPTLRVNLALALLKTGQPEEALTHLMMSLEINPDHDRAWGYLGLTHWRLGRFDEARDAFLRGGQATMAQRMEAVLHGGRPMAEVSADDDGDRAAMRSAAEEAIEQFEQENVPLSVEQSRSVRTSGEWQVGEPGEEQVPNRLRFGAALPLSAPPRLDALVDEWLLSLPEDSSLAIGRDGELFIHTQHDLHARIAGLRAVRGELRTTPVQRRTRGRELPEVLGGNDPILLWRGPIAAVCEPPEGRRFQGITLDGDVLYVREELVTAFDGRVGFESGRLPLAGDEITLIQLYGKGSVVLALAGAPSALRVSEGDEVRVVPSALLGWTGRLLPRGASRRGTAPYSASAPPLSFRGEGVVLVL